MTGRIDSVDEAAQARDAAAYRAQLEAVAERRSAARAELDAANAELARWCGAADQDRPGVHDPRPRGRGRRASTGCQRSGRCRGAQARAARVGHGDRLEHQGVSPRRGSAAGRRGRICWAFRTGVEAKFVADVNLNADRARRGLDDPDGRPSVPDRAQDSRIPGLVATCRPERPQLRVGQQLAVLADPRRGGGPGSQRRSAADPVSTTMVSALLGLPADRLAEQRARGAARPGTGGGHPAGAPMDRCAS